MRHPLARVAALAVAAAVTVPLTLDAHRQWMLPSSTVLSGEEPWVTIDAASSNDLFYFDHNPLRLDNLVVTAPDGSTVSSENVLTGRYRSTFDVRLAQKGTYKIAVVNDTVNASFDQNGQVTRWRGTSAAFAKEVPQNAPGLAVSKTQTRLEVFVTSGKPTDLVLRPSNVGLELRPVTHPNDIVTGEAATLGLVLDGKPAAGIEVTVIPGGIRYRDALNERTFTTDREGRFRVTFEEPGMYWMNASYQEGPSGRLQTSAADPNVETASGRRGGPRADEQEGRGAAAGQGGGRGGRGRGQTDTGPVQPGRRASYTATFEVLPQ